METQETVELTGVKFKRPIYDKGNGIAIHLTGILAGVCGLSGIKEIEIELLKSGQGFIVRGVKTEQ